MADLDHRFDAITEEFYDLQLAHLRQRAERGIPDGVSVEIGANRGAFIRGMAELHPERHFIGIELRKKWAEYAQDSLERAGLDARAEVLRADATFALPILFDDAQIKELFILYPDPWWKTRHRKRRVVRDDLLDVIATKMAPGAPLWIRSDVGPLANDMRAVLNAHPKFRLLPLERYPKQPFPRSERDRLSIKKGMPVHILYYERV
ncbi:MAG: hypothetical protein AAGA20_01530 [Planctomycetota bacterium]